MLDSTDQISHRNHYVPEFYLRNWSEDGNTIYVYSLLVPDKAIPYWSKKSIKYTAKWNDFYTWNVGERQVDDIEKWFNEKFETPAKAVIEKIIGDTELSSDESRVLTRFIAAQHIRTPARLDWILRLLSRKTPRLLLKTTRRVARRNYRHQLQSNKPTKQTRQTNKADFLPIKAKINKDAKTLEVDTVVGKGMYLYALTRILTVTVKKIEHYKWFVIHAAAGIQFPTTDDPVICLNYYSMSQYDFEGGWGRKNGIIILPISPSRLIITIINNTIPIEMFDNSTEWSLFFRKIIIEHAHRYVYAISKQKGMLAINPRIANKAMFEKEKKEMADWHNDCIESEKDYR